MIDLRSDTVTLPTPAMLETIPGAKLGDDGRRKKDGTGGDDTVLRLEQLAAALTGKEAALFFPSGTMANTAALLSACAPGDKVLADSLLHMVVSEKAAFDPRLGRLTPVFYQLTADGVPDLSDLTRVLEESGAKMICVENTHNFSGGACIPPDLLERIGEAARKNSVLLHMDGARLFNAACALGVEARELCRPADTVMFCLSKGLGAPMGSLLCGSAPRMAACREVRKLLGGGLRQAGIAAAPGIYALEHNIGRIAQDHQNARLFAEALGKATRKVRVAAPVHTNIVLLDPAGAGLSREEFQAGLEARGVGSHLVPQAVRMVFHLGVSREEALEAARIAAEFANEPREGI